jgi:hypothetical protein
MMRTTLTIDDDVAVLIERVRNERGTNFKSLVNEALRHGLRAMTEKPARERHFQTQPLDLGECLLPSLDNIGDVLAMLEGEDHR